MTKRYADILGDGGSGVVAQVEEKLDRLRERMAPVRHKVAVMSGKGGVGKSSITVNLAAALGSLGRSVGVLDADINGPSIGRMLGRSAQPLRLKAASVSMLLPDEQTPVRWEAPGKQGSYVWRGTMEASALRELLADTEWGALDYLVIDLPPGPQGLATLAELLPGVTVLMVTIPSKVSRTIVEKSTNLARELGCRILGQVENMAGYVCARCGEVGELFPAGSASDTQVLGSVPFDPRIAVSTDWGVPFVLEHPDSPAGMALRSVAEKVEALMAPGGES